MPVGEAVRNELIELERSLWRPRTRFDQRFMDGVLAEDFLEFGRSGRIWSRAQTLAAATGPIEATLRDFRVHLLVEGVALVTYVSEVRHEVLDLPNRASIWVRRDGRWQLRFHQGTPTA